MVAKALSESTDDGSSRCSMAREGTCVFKKCAFSREDGSLLPPRSKRLKVVNRLPGVWLVSPGMMLLGTQCWSLLLIDQARSSSFSQVDLMGKFRLLIPCIASVSVAMAILLMDSLSMHRMLWEREWLTLMHRLVYLIIKNLLCSGYSLWRDSYGHEYPYSVCEFWGDPLICSFLRFLCHQSSNYVPSKFMTIWPNHMVYLLSL